MLRPWLLAIMMAWGTSTVVGEEGPVPKFSFLVGSGEEVDYPSNPTPTFDAEATATYSGLPCKFTFTPEKSMMHYIYDVCPLLHRHKHDGNNDGGNKGKNVEVDERPIRIRIEEKTPPTLTTSVYDLALRTPLKRNGTLPAELQCPDDTRICLIVENTRPSHPSEPKRRLQVVQVAGGSEMTHRAWRGPQTPGNDSTPVILHYMLSGGKYVDKEQKAYFAFVCDQNSQPEPPTYLWRWNGLHAFQWASRHACPTVIKHRDPAPKPSPDEDPAPVDGPPDIPEAPQEQRVLRWPVVLLFSLVVLVMIRMSMKSKRTQVSFNTATIRWITSSFRGKNEVIFDELENMEEYNPVRLEMVPLPDSHNSQHVQKGSRQSYGTV